MKFKGQIMSVDTSVRSEDVLVLTLVAASNSIHRGGRNHEASVSVRLEVPRDAVHDFALGDWFTIEIDKVR